MSDVKSLETAMEMYYQDNNGYPTSNGSSNGDVVMSDATLVSKMTKYISMPALLVADGDHYYADGATSGVQTLGYDMLIYIANTNSWCRAGTLPGNTGDWGVPTTCNF